MVGALQWLILRRQLSRAGWWVLANVGGWVVAVAVVMSLAGVFAVFWAVAGAVAMAAQGAITGRTLVWLLRQPLSDQRKDLQ